MNHTSFLSGVVLNAETISQCCKTVRDREREKKNTSKTATFVQQTARSLAMETIRSDRENNKADFFICGEKWNWVTQGRGGISIFLCVSARFEQPCRKQSAQRTKKKERSSAKKMRERLNKKKICK